MKNLCMGGVGLKLPRRVKSLTYKINLNVQIEIVCHYNVSRFNWELALTKCNRMRNRKLNVDKPYLQTYCKYIFHNEF